MTYCLYQEQKYSEGSTISLPDGRIQKCVCKDGKCRWEDVDASNETSAAISSSKDGCFYGDAIHPEGSTIFLPDGRMQKCVCKDGKCRWEDVKKND